MGNPEQQIALSFSGRLFGCREEPFNPQKKKECVTLVAELVQKEYRVFIACGGGTRSRNAIKSARERGVHDPDELDKHGIKATQVHARYLALVLKEAGLHTQWLRTSHHKQNHDAIIFTIGGDEPGHTTDYLAVKTAIENGIPQVINFTDGPVYERGPDGNLDHNQPIKQMTFENYLKMFPLKHEPGLNAPFEPQAALLAKEAGLTVVVLDENNLNNLPQYLSGEDFTGTVILPDNPPPGMSSY